ncbi:hypothetical protein EOL72_00250 [Candidatus Falkowbacteria bacterium]|nr:hypothetical protein [Candidatus Falkowbacteria bacterium]
MRTNFFSMENILEKIVKEQKQEELEKLNAINIVANLLSELPERESDVLSRRYGLRGGRGETLEKIGQTHNLTRERVRQIEVASVKKIKKLDKIDSCLGAFKEAVAELIKRHGGLLNREYLLDILTVYALELGRENRQELDSETKVIYRNHADFLISKLLEDEIETLKKSDRFVVSYKLKASETKILEDLADDLLNRVSHLSETMPTEDLLELIKGLDAYNRYQEEIIKDGDLDVTSVFKSKIFPDKGELINSNKVLYGLLRAVRGVARNNFGYWGSTASHEIKPKTVNDKIYLILKNTGHPLHFTEIAQRINEVGFDKKSANPATVHNELILDSRYILTGRGMYGLKEWQEVPVEKK